MIKKFSILFLFIIAVFVLYLVNQGNSDVKSATQTIFYTIDGFERPGEWRVKFSKFRSKRWNRQDEKKGDDSRDADKDWYDWFKADGSNFTKRELLPDFIAKNSKAPQNKDSKVFTNRYANMLSKELTIFGVKARWDFHGYNWFSLVPVPLESGGDENRYGPNKLGRYSDEIVNNDSLNDEDYKNYGGGNYILLPGLTQEIALFVWGSLYDYKLEFHVEDSNGNLHALDAGSIKFKGWRRVGLKIPKRVGQASGYLPRTKPLKLRRIKLILNPKERISGTYLYFDYLHGKTNTYLKGFFGEGLENSQQIWKRNKNKGATSGTNKGKGTR